MKARFDGKKHQAGKLHSPDYCNGSGDGISLDLQITL